MRTLTSAFSSHSTLTSDSPPRQSKIHGCFFTKLREVQSEHEVHIAGLRKVDTVLQDDFLQLICNALYMRDSDTHSETFPFITVADGVIVSFA